MAELRKKVLKLSTGRQIKLYGNCVGIGKTLEIGEGYAPNIFSGNNEQSEGNKTPVVINPHQLTREEIIEIADLNMQLWMDLKENVRKYGVDNPKIFARDGSH